MREYSKREIEINGRSVLCQFLNWQDGSPPRYLVCHPVGDET